MTELIKTRKQYEETLDFLKINRFAYDEANEIDDLIEGLREVVRAAQFAKYMAATPFDKPLNEQLDKLRVALDKVPDWIEQDG